MAAQQQQDKKLQELFLQTLKDVYYAEKQILKALPRMAKAADSDQLKAAFEKHREQTEHHVERLEQIFDIIGKRAQGVPCEGIQGIIEEGKEVMQDFKASPALDPGLIASAQAVEHYEIARYGTLATWAKQLGMGEALNLLLETKKEEEQTDKDLTKLAKTSINKMAA